MGCDNPDCGNGGPCLPNCFNYPSCDPCTCYQDTMSAITFPVLKVRIYDTLEETPWLNKLTRNCILYRMTCRGCRTFVPLCSITSYCETETVDGVKDIPDEDYYYKVCSHRAIHYLENISLDELKMDKNFPPFFLKQYSDPPYPYFLCRTKTDYVVY